MIYFTTNGQKTIILLFIGEILKKKMSTILAVWLAVNSAIKLVYISLNWCSIDYVKSCHTINFWNKNVCFQIVYSTEMHAKLDYGMF